MKPQDRRLLAPGETHEELLEIYGSNLGAVYDERLVGASIQLRNLATLIVACWLCRTAAEERRGIQRAMLCCGFSSRGIPEDVWSCRGYSRIPRRPEPCEGRTILVADVLSGYEYEGYHPDLLRYTAVVQSVEEAREVARRRSERRGHLEWMSVTSVNIETGETSVIATAEFDAGIEVS